ncbi:MAG: glycosyltransferase family 2 protein [Bacteroidia bacterium]
MTAPFVSVIIPCFNEQEIVAETFHRVKSSVEGGWNNGHEIIFINDGSRDATLFILKNFAAENSSVRILNFSRNFGHQAAVTAGLANCKGDVAFIIDADLQDPPELFETMYKLSVEKNCNVVNGVREKREGESFFKKITARIFYRLLNNLSDVNLNIDTGDFRMIDRKVINAFNSFPEKNKYIRGLISWMGFKQESISYTRSARSKGKTKYPLGKMMKLAFVAIFYFSKKPLKISLTIGFISILIGLLLMVWVFIQQALGLPLIKGWASTVIIVIFFGGIQLVTIGVAGEYIGNILDEVKNRPEYLIEEKINF